MQNPKKVRIGKSIVITLPENYTRKPLPWMNKWLKALRSGKYKQGRNLLYRTNRFCCLGVLSKIQGRLSKTGCDGTVENPDYQTSLSKTNPCFDAFIHDVKNNLDWLRTTDAPFPNGVGVHFTSTRKGAKFNRSVSSLAILNDGGAKFSTIAKVIEVIWSQETTKKS